MSRRDHWEAAHRARVPEAMSWFQAAPAPSLRALAAAAVPPGAALLDVGGGASRLVDRLLERGWSDLTVLDIAAPALAAARARLGAAAARVRWEIGDITAWEPPRRFDAWHDRAVYHFLVEEAERAAYRRALAAGTAPGAAVILATFAPDGPERCSGLPVRRADAARLAADLGSGFRLLEAWREDHRTPAAAVQPFQWALFRRDDRAA